MNQKYHHGELPQTLRTVTAQIISEKGPTGFSLREVARKAGVSHAAPAHHFGNVAGLLTSVAIEGLTKLNDAFLAVQNSINPVDRVVAMGKAYLTVALNNPGHFSVMCTKSLINADDVEYVKVSAVSFELLEQAITAIADQHNPALDIKAATALTWSAVHGLALLAPSLCEDSDLSASKQLAEVEQMLEKFAVLLMHGYKER